MKLIIMRTSLCALETQKGRAYVPGVCNYGYAPLSQIFSYLGSRFNVLLTVFQSYQDDVWMIMKGCVQWNSVYG